MPSSLQEQLEKSWLLRWAFAVAAGAMLALAFPKWSIAALAFVALGPLVCAIVASRGIGSAFFVGWIALTTTWLINVRWVVDVMQIHGGIPLPIGIALWIAMAAYLGLYGGLFAAVVRSIRPGASIASWLLIPLVWAGVEYARAHLFSGFPWNLTAESIVDIPLVMPSRVIGPYGVGALVVTPGVFLAWLLMRKAARIERVAVVLGLVALVLSWGAWSVWLLDGEENAIAHDAVHRVALIQPDISQEMRWDQALVMTIFRKMVSMTNDAVDRGAEVVIWPESTVPLDFESTPFYKDWVEQETARSGVDIILGSVAIAGDDSNKVWNSAYLVEKGRIAGRYDKVRLVPWGEYVPLKHLLFFAKKLVKEVGEFTPGDRIEPLVGHFRYGLAICYEIVFPDIAREQVRRGANLLVTITNDGWFGHSAAPRQHLNGARLRAVETERWLVRAATTGITAVVDPTGRIVDELDVGRRGVVIGDVAARRTITPYVRFGDWLGILVILVSAIAVIARKGWRHEG